MVTVDSNTFINKVIGTPKELQDALYLVENTNLNAYNSRVVNVATPVSATDAANKAYVDALLDTTLQSTSASYQDANQVPNAVSAKYAFGPTLADIPGTCILKSMTLKSANNAQISANTQLLIFDYQKNLLCESNKTSADSGFNQLVKFVFNNDNSIVIDKLSTYWLMLKTNGEPTSQGVRLINTNVMCPNQESFRVYGIGGTDSTNPRWTLPLYVDNIEFYSVYHTISGIVMTDKDTPSKKYLVQILNGSFQITNL